MGFCHSSIRFPPNSQIYRHHGTLSRETRTILKVRLVTSILLSASLSMDLSLAASSSFSAVSDFFLWLPRLTETLSHITALSLITAMCTRTSICRRLTCPRQAFRAYSQQRQIEVEKQIKTTLSTTMKRLKIVAQLPINSHLTLHFSLYIFIYKFLLYVRDLWMGGWG